MRLVAQRFSQRPIVIVSRYIHCLIVDARTPRYLIGDAIYEKLDLQFIDVVTKYLYVYLDNDIYMRILEWLKIPKSYNLDVKESYNLDVKKLYLLKLQDPCIDKKKKSIQIW